MTKQVIIDAPRYHTPYMVEYWAPVVGYEGIYEVSTAGRVRRVAGSVGCPKGRILTVRIDSHGYVYTALWANNKGKTYRVHTLVLQAFVGEAPDGYECCHKDGVRSNCTLDNLRWGSHASNLADKKEHGTSYAGWKHHWTTIQRAKERVHKLRSKGLTQQQVADILGISQPTVSYYCSKG